MSTFRTIQMYASVPAQNVQPVPVIRRDVTGGVNTRQHPSHITETQSVVMTNINIDTLGKRIKRSGSVAISDDMGAESVLALHDYQRQGYTDQLMCIEDNNLNAIESEGNHAEVKGDFTAAQTDWGIISAKESGIVPDDIIIVQNGTNNPFRFQKDSAGSWQTQDLGATAGTGSDSPPKSTVMAWYGNRIWVLKNDLLYFSAPYSADYASAFDTVADWYRIPVGDERGISPTRDTGIIVMGKNAIWGLAPSAVPAATDKPEPLVTAQGVVSKKGWCSVGDDLFFFSQDGLRSLKRTVQDKLQFGSSYPISWNLKEQFEEIDFAYIERLTMVYYPIRNIIKITVPTGANTFKTWIYYPATNSFTIEEGKSPRCYATHKISGDQRLYYGVHGDGMVYRDDYGFTDEGTTTTNGTAITSTEEGREEDFGQPLVDKWGGEIEIEASAVGGSYELDVSVKSDGGNYISLGSMSLASSTAPTLPVDLPFTLADDYVIRQKFPLDALGSFRTLQVKIVNEDTNTEVIGWQGVNLVTSSEEYQNV
jgi:hypothetical protein